MIAIPSPISRSEELICCDLPEIDFSRTYSVWDAWKLRIDIAELPIPIRSRERLIREVNAEVNLFELEQMALMAQEDRRQVNIVVPISLACLGFWILVCLWVA
jgi:hypothetical protein